MIKLVTRIIALLLVSCLAADPVTAAALSNSSFSRPLISQSHQSVFQEEAIVSPFVSAAKSMLSKITARAAETHMAEALIPAPVPVQARTTRDRLTMPIRTGKFGNPWHATHYNEIVEAAKQGGRRITFLMETLRSDRLVYGLTSEHIKEIKSHVWNNYNPFDFGSYGRAHLSDADVHGDWVVGRMQEGGKFVFRPENGNFDRWRPFTGERPPARKDRVYRRKVEHTIDEALKALGRTRADLPKDLVVERRAFHDFPGEKDPLTNTVIVDQQYSTNLGVWIRELNNVFLTGATDQEKLYSSFVAWARHVGSKAIHASLEAMGASSNVLDILSIAWGGLKHGKPEVGAAGKTPYETLLLAAACILLYERGQAQHDGQDRQTFPIRQPPAAPNSAQSEGAPMAREFLAGQVPKTLDHQIFPDQKDRTGDFKLRSMVVDKEGHYFYLYAWGELTERRSMYSAFLVNAPGEQSRGGFKETKYLPAPDHSVRYLRDYGLTLLSQEELTKLAQEETQPPVATPAPAKYRDLMTVPMAPQINTGDLRVVTISKDEDWFPVFNASELQMIAQMKMPKDGFEEVIERGVAAMGCEVDARGGPFTELGEQLEKLGLKSVTFVMDSKLDAPEETLIDYAKGITEIHFHPKLIEGGSRDALIGAVIKGLVNVITKVEIDKPKAGKTDLLSLVEYHARKELNTIPFFLAAWVAAVSIDGVRAALGTLGDGVIPMMEMFDIVIGYIDHISCVSNSRPSIKQLGRQAQGDRLWAWFNADPGFIKLLIIPMLGRIYRAHPGFLFVKEGPNKGQPRDLMAVPMGQSHDSQVPNQPRPILAAA